MTFGLTGDTYSYSDHHSNHAKSLDISNKMSEWGDDELTGKKAKDRLTKTENHSDHRAIVLAKFEHLGSGCGFV